MNVQRRTFLGGAGALLAAASLFQGARVLAAERDGTLTIAFASETSSVDPHWHIVTANSSVSQHIFDRLVHLDATQTPVPGLATAWKSVDDNTWEFVLREGVTFHDGAPLTVEDVIFSYDRAQNVPGAIFNLRAYLGDKTFEKVDEKTLRVRTQQSNPLVPIELSTTAIISRRIGEGATSADYNSGKAAIGTGPFKFVEYVPGARIVMERHDAYWGAKPEWRKVVIQPIAVGGSRVAALQAGDVDMIDSVPPADIAHLESAAGVALERGVANRMIFLSFDQGRKVSPFVRGKDGSEIPNPFLDLRVRQAINLAIDKKAIAARILEGNGQAAEQLVPPGIFGHNAGIKLVEPDIAKAKALLAEAGLPDGFRVTLHGPNDRFIRDTAVVQAVAQMLTRIGIATEVETMPGTVFYKRASGGGPEDGSEFSFFLIGYGAATGEVSAALRNLVHSFDKSKGFGSNNRLRYSNRELDAMIEKGLGTLDDDARRALFEEVCARAMNDVAVLPLYYPISVWGMKNSLTYTGRTDERTLAFDVTMKA